MIKHTFIYLTISVSAGFITVGQVLATDIYKCTGADGSVKFQQAPCGAKSNAVKIQSKETDKGHDKSTAISNEDRILKQKNMADALEQERLLKKQEQEKRSKERTRAKQNCTRARDRLAEYQNASGVYRLDKEGRKVYGTEAQRQQAIREMRKTANYWCRKAGR